MTNSSNLIERIKNFRQFWTLMLRHVQMPNPQEMGFWLIYPDSCVLEAIAMTSKKFAREKLAADFKPEFAYRYVSAVARTRAERKEARLAVQQLSIE